MSVMEERETTMILTAVLTIRRMVLQLGTVQFPYQTIMKLVRMLSSPFIEHGEDLGVKKAESF